MGTPSRPYNSDTKKANSESNDRIRFTKYSCCNYKMASVFMTSLYETLKAKGLAESTVKQYLRNLVSLNGKKPFDSLKFLQKKKEVDAMLIPYAWNTRKNMLVTIISVLAPHKDERGFKKVYKEYYEDAMAMTKKPNDHSKSETQEKNWIEWKDVEDAMSQLRAIAKPTFNDTFKRLLLALYTEIPPRRNQDYFLMYVVPKITDDLPTDKNYYSPKQKLFVFNKYKTEKKYGQQRVDVPEGLQKELSHYLSQHPLSKEKQYPLLVTKDGEPLNAPNTITRALNSIFGKRVGASMLRHVYLTHKYGNVLEEQQEDSRVMAHSLNTQKEYIKE